MLLRGTSLFRLRAHTRHTRTNTAVQFTQHSKKTHWGRRAYCTPVTSSAQNPSERDPFPFLKHTWEQVEPLIPKSDNPDPKEWETLKQHAAKVYTPDLAELLVTELQENRTKEKGITRDVESYNRSLKARAALLMPGRMMEIFREMKQLGVQPNEETYRIVINGTVIGSSFQDCWSTFQEMKKRGYKLDAFIYTRMVHACGCQGEPEYLPRLEREFEAADFPKEDPWYPRFFASLAESYIRWGCERQSLDALDTLKRKGFPWTYESAGTVLLLWAAERFQELPAQFMPLVIRFQSMGDHGKEVLKPEDLKGFTEFVHWLRTRPVQ